MDVATNKVTAMIGPSGCGKSTLLRTLNRMHETLRHTRLEGEISLDGVNILTLDVTKLRRMVGMVFQKPNPFPKSIYENVAYGLRINGLQGAPGRCGGKKPAPRRAVGRSEGQAAQVGLRAFRRASNSGCASPGRWRSIPKCSCWMSRVPRSIR